jgi:hypothetical protein
MLPDGITAEVPPREIGLLILSVVVTWAGAFIAIKPREYKEELTDHPIGWSPIWAIRALGTCMTAAGIWIFYQFLLS